RRSDIFSKLEIDQALNGVYGGDDHPDLGADAEASFVTAPYPRETILLHDVLVVTQRVRVQKTVYGDVQDLHKATELDHGRDQAVEGLTDPLAQVRALEEGVDIPVRFVGALLEFRGALAQDAQGVDIVLHGAAAGGLDERLQRTVDDEVGIAS